MEEEEIIPFESINHRSIVSAIVTDGTRVGNNDQQLKINISNLKLIPIVFMILGIFLIFIGLIFYLFVVKVIGYILLFFGVISFSYGIYSCITLKYKYEFFFKSPKLIVKMGGLICLNNKEYLISKLDYIIIDQIHVENDGEKRFSDDEKQEEIPCKIIINSIEEGYEEVFSGSGNPPLFTNDEVQYFNQFMKVIINRIKNDLL